DLGLIRSYVNDAEEAMQKRGFTDPEVETSLAKVTAATQKVLDLSEKLKRRVAFGFDEATVFPVSAVLGEVKEIFRTLLPSQQLTVDPSDGFGSIRAVQPDVVDILRDLVNNGFEAMPDGGTVTVRVCGEEHSVLIEVEDTGNGIPEEELDII